MWSNVDSVNCYFNLCSFSRRQKIDACGFSLIKGWIDGHHWNVFLPKQEQVSLRYLREHYLTTRRIPLFWQNIIEQLSTYAYFIVFKYYIMISWRTKCSIHQVQSTIKVICIKILIGKTSYLAKIFWCSVENIRTADIQWIRVIIKSLSLGTSRVFFTSQMDCSSGGLDTPLYGLYRYVWPQRVWFSSRFGHK